MEDTYSDYRKFCRHLKSLKNIDFACYGDYEYNLKEKENEQSWFDFKNFDPKNDRKRFFLRHDIDKDPLTSLKLAKIEAEYGIRSTFFYLYSGSTIMDRWRSTSAKKEELISILRAIQDLGHEIGLHYDIYGDYFVGGLDCSAALESSLSFLRANGLKISGCCAHSAARCRVILGSGAATPEEFTNWNAWREINSKMPRKELKCNGKVLSSPVLSLNDYGLKYEAYFVARRRSDLSYIADASTKPEIRKGLWSGGFGEKPHKHSVLPLEKTIESLARTLEDQSVNIVSWLTHPYLWDRKTWPI